MSLFFYEREVAIDATPDQPAGTTIYRDSFNLDKVIRSLQIDTDKVIVLLDDVHERPEDVPEVKNGKVVGQKRVRNVFQTEITLEGDDVTRFNNLANN